MSNIEKESKKRRKRVEVATFILQTVSTAGLIGVALVAPNVIGAMGKIGLLPSARQKDVIRRSQENLVRKGLLIWKNGYLELSPLGKLSLLERELAYTHIHKQRRWDKKWRVLIFDIPEKKRGVRDHLRITLRSIGFLRIQDSVWLYPYDCEDFITLLKTDMKIGKEMLYMIVDMIEDESAYRKHFKLPNTLTSNGR